MDQTIEVGMSRLVPVGRAAVVALGAALALSSCITLPFGSDPAPTSTRPSSALPPPAGQEVLATFYAQRLQWQSCQGGECATLRVPIDYANPSGDTIELALLRVRARSSSQRIGSIVVNPGGPGGSGVDYAKAADFIVGSSVRRRFDIVGFDPRGVGRSAPIDCIDDGALDHFLGMDPTPDTGAEQQALLTEATALAEGCQERGGALLAHVSTVDAARDMDVLRAALGETTLSYLGKSYGTLLGATYAGLFPRQVGRFVLDGVVPPDLTSAELSEGQARGFEAATRAFMQDCVDDGDCPFGSTIDEGVTWLQDFLKGLDSTPVRVSADGEVTALTEGWGSLGIAYALYDQGSWATLTKALQAGERGQGDDLMDLADSYADRERGGGYTGNIMEVIYAVNCLDRPDTADPDQIMANETAFSRKAPTWGRFLAWGSVPCGVWPLEPTGSPHKITAEGSPPIVVVGTTRDPATIYEWSVRLRGELANAVLVTYDGDGHTAYSRSSSCVDKPIDEFFVTGTPPQDGLRC
ncbi:MAG TPA: alpha/beta hydrolase [Candidatus Lustribacter sp.]|nr:alpha/beta hydrolase [Candidatus Lustribacter sp.]